MCGRFVLDATPAEVVKTFDLDGIEDFPARYNISPTQPIIVVRHRAVEPGSNLPPREATFARWGLIPPWANDPKDVPLLINARSETAAGKASFRSAMKRGRILVPASGFYEWRRTGQGKAKVLEPFYVRPRDGRTLAFAGLMEDGEIPSAAIMTVDANETCRPIHHRMPIVVEPVDFDRWLDCDAHSVADATAIMRTPDDAFFEAIPVSDRVNKATNQGADLIEPVERDAPPEPEPIVAEPEPRQGSLF